MPHEIPVIIEIPKNSKVKYEINHDTQELIVDRILPSAYNYPHNYGYLDKTLAEDNDPIDILVLNDQAFFPGSIIKCYPVGVLLMEDHGEIDPKIIAVPIPKVDKRYSDINDITDISKHELNIIKDFFENYKNNENKTVICKGFENQEHAQKLINEAYERYHI